MSWGIKGNPILLHVSHDAFINQHKGLKSAKLYKRFETMTLNTHKFMEQQIKLKLKDADKPTKRQKVTQQIQRGYDIARKWKDESREDASSL